jgi:hypothetical protein
VGIHERLRARGQILGAGGPAHLRVNEKAVA